jgi:hypothetical protein
MPKANRGSFKEDLIRSMWRSRGFKRYQKSNPGQLGFSYGGAQSQDITGQGVLPGEFINYGEGSGPSVFVGGTGRAEKNFIDPMVDTSSDLFWSHKIAASHNWDAYSPSVPLTKRGVANLGRWQSSYVHDRGSMFYGHIDPISFSKQYAAQKLEVGRRGKRWFKTISGGDPDTGPKVATTQAELNAMSEDVTATVEDMSSERITQDDWARSERFSGDPQVGYHSGVKNPSGMRIMDKPRLSRTARMAEGDIARVAAYNEYISKDYGARLTKFAPWLSNIGLLHKPTQGANAIYSNRAAMDEHFMEAFGQTKTLISDSGQSVNWSGLKLSKKMLASGPLNSRVGYLAGKVMEDGSSKKFERAFRNLADALITSGDEHGVDDFFRDKSYDDISNQHSQAVQDMLGEFRDAKTKKELKAARKKMKNFAKKAISATTSNEVVAAGVEDINIGGFERLQEAIQTSEIGQEFVTSAGEKVKVAYATGSGDIMVKTMKNSPWKGKVVPLSVVEGHYERQLTEILDFRKVKKSFFLSAVREPGVYEGVASKHRVKLLWGTGELAGFMEDKAAREFQKDTESGYLGEVLAEFSEFPSGIGARISHGDTPLGYVQRTRGRKGRLFSDSLGQTIQSRWQRAFKGDDSLTRIDETTKYLMNTFYKTEHATTNVDAMGSMIDLTKTGGKVAKGLWVGLTIAAGALAMWGASKLRGNVPITENDVPKSMYGNVDISSGKTGQIYTPGARVVQNNTGYATNIDMETTDSNGYTDYRPMARGLGAISSSAMGVGRTSTSLHVVDQSGRMDRESTRRSINQHLGA